MATSTSSKSPNSSDSHHLLEYVGGDGRTKSRESFNEFEDGLEYETGQQPRPPKRSFLARTYRAIALSIRNRTRRSTYSKTSTQAQDKFSGVLHRRKSTADEKKRARRRKCGSLRKALWVVPCLTLMFFGFLHLLQVLVGGTRLFWDADAYNDYLPDWGKPGQIGDGLPNYPTDATRDVIPIPCHSHNDYWRRIPLFDAIHWGCTGVEADVWLFDEELFVGHSTASLTRNRTFRNLYINPLVKLLDSMNPTTNEVANSTSNGDNSLRGVFDEDPDQTLVLLVDVKTDGHETYHHVYHQTQALRDKDYLSYWDADGFHSRAITIVGTGNTPFEKIVADQEYRDIFFDAPLDELYLESTTQDGEEDENDDEEDDDDEDNNDEDNDDEDNDDDEKDDAGEPESPQIYNSSSAYYASVSFTQAVGVTWLGSLSNAQMDIIRGQIRGARARGLKARYWDTPSWPVFLRNHIWEVLMQEGASVLNVDDLQAAATENWKARGHQLW